MDELSGLDVPRGPSAENPIARVTGGAGGEGRSNSGSAGAAAARPPPEGEGSYVRPRHHAWADLLRRTFAFDVLDCPECGGRLRFLATIAQRGGAASDEPDGCVAEGGRVWGCYIHGICASEPFRRGWLRSLGWREQGGAAPAVDPYDRLADHVEASLDPRLLAKLLGLTSEG